MLHSCSALTLNSFQNVITLAAFGKVASFFRVYRVQLTVVLFVLPCCRVVLPVVAAPTLFAVFAEVGRWAATNGCSSYRISAASPAGPGPVPSPPAGCRQLMSALRRLGAGYTSRPAPRLRQADSWGDTPAATAGPAQPGLVLLPTSAEQRRGVETLSLLGQREPTDGRRLGPGTVF